MRKLLERGHRVVLEVGPGSTLSALASETEPSLCTVASLPVQNADPECIERAFARLWELGVVSEPGAVWAGRERRRVGLPGYAFDPLPCLLASSSVQQVPSPGHAGQSAAPRAEAAVRDEGARDASTSPTASVALVDVVLEVFRAALGSPDMGAHDDFFAWADIRSWRPVSQQNYNAGRDSG